MTVTVWIRRDQLESLREAIAQESEHSVEMFYQERWADAATDKAIIAVTLPYRDFILLGEKFQPDSYGEDEEEGEEGRGDRDNWDSCNEEADATAEEGSNWNFIFGIPSDEEASARDEETDQDGDDFGDFGIDSDDIYDDIF